MATLFGDTAGTLSGRERGRAQRLAGEDRVDNLIAGDAGEAITDRARGGHDHVTGGDNAAGAPRITNTLFGDAPLLSGEAKGGHDRVRGGEDGAVTNWLHGDARQMEGDARGGNDHVTGGSGSTEIMNLLYGDAEVMTDRTRGGNDHLVAGEGAGLQSLSGDAAQLLGQARGGNDVLIGGDRAGRNSLYGDAQQMWDETRGGNDWLRGGDNARGGVLVGDASQMLGNARGGDDVLIGGIGDQTASSIPGNPLYGDAIFMLDRTVGGNDVLVSAAGTRDRMYGEALEIGPEVTTGYDRFVFRPGNGEDTIGDFEAGKDRIVLVGFGFGFDGFDALAPLIRTEGEDAVVDFGGGNSITLLGVTGLAPSDVLLIG